MAGSGSSAATQVRLIDREERKGLGSGKREKAERVRSPIIWHGSDIKRMKRKDYENEPQRLGVELVIFEGWIQHGGLKVAIIFEGRGSAGKGGPSKRTNCRLSVHGRDRPWGRVGQF